MKKIKAVIFDWAGTTVDFGCMAPVQAFVEVFKEFGIEPTMEEVREPMGMLKIDHIRTMLKMERIRNLWIEKYGKDPEEEDAQKMYAIFEETTEHPSPVLRSEAGSRGCSEQAETERIQDRIHDRI